MKALEVFGELAEAAESDVDLPGADETNLDWALAARVDFGVDSKQEVLASTSPRERMAKLVGLLETALEAVQLEAQLRERAGRNGTVSPLDSDP